MRVVSGNTVLQQREGAKKSNGKENLAISIYLAPSAEF